MSTKVSIRRSVLAKYRRFRIFRLIDDVLWKMGGSQHLIWQLSRLAPLEIKKEYVVIEINSSNITDPEINAKLVALGARVADMVTGEVNVCADVYLATDNGRSVAVCLVKKAEHIRSWYIALPPKSIVTYGWYTAPEFRGVGAMPYLLTHAISKHSDTAEVFADCRTNNAASIRSLEKLGFSAIAIRKKITRNASKEKSR